MKASAIGRGTLVAFPIFALLDAPCRPGGFDRVNEFRHMQGCVPSALLGWLREGLTSAGLATIFGVHRRHNRSGGHSFLGGTHCVTLSTQIGRIGDKLRAWTYVADDRGARALQVVGKVEQTDYILGYCPS